MVQAPTSSDIAQYIYNRLDWIDAWKLQKLTYYVQAWSLGWYGRAIFNEDFQAWQDGPVEPSLHNENKYGRDSWKSCRLPSADVTRLSDEQKQIADAVLDYYGHMSREELIDQTHAEAPWKLAWKDLKPNERGNEIINKSEMRRHYARVELSGTSAPTRPFLSADPVDKLTTSERLQAQVTRWKSAIDILASR